MKAPFFGFLTVLGLVGLDWEESWMTTSFSFGYEGSDKEVDGKCSCEGR